LENILVDIESEDIVTKLIDFGFSTQTETFYEKLKTYCGTPAFMSPQLCNRKEYHGPSADVWASGVVLYTIFYGTQPFRARTEKDLYKKISSGAVSFPKHECQSREIKKIV